MAREAKEEINVSINPDDLVPVHTLNFMDEDKIEYLVLFFTADKWKGTPKNMEPKKHSELVWVDADKLPNNIMPAARHALEMISKGIIYSEYGW